MAKLKGVTQKVNILIITTVRFRLNGITSVIMNYYRNMDRTDMHIDMVVPNRISKKYQKELEENGVNIFYIARNTNPLNYQKKLYKVLKEGNYDIVHIHGNSALMLFDILPVKRAKVPVRIVHSHNTTCSHRILHKVLLPFFKKSYTHGFACGLEAGKWLFEDGQFEVLKNGIDLGCYRYNTEVRQEYRNKLQVGDYTVIGHIGNFIEQKNHEFLLETFAELIKKDESYRLLLISDGVLFERMKEKAQKLGISNYVLFLGKTMEVQNYLQAMDLFVLPSLHEGLPVVLVEAQAAGLPCIVSDTVAKEADLTNSIHFIPISGSGVWVNEIEKITAQLSLRNRAAISEAWQDKMADDGYDIIRNANKMKELYWQYFEVATSNGVKKV